MRPRARAARGAQTTERAGGGCVHRCFFRCETLPCRQTSPLRASFPSAFPPGSDSLRRRNRHQRARLEKAHLRSGGGATICCLYLSGERSLRLPARVAPPPFAPLRGASSRTDWLGASGRPTFAVAAVWWPAQAGHQRRAGERTRFALIRPTNRSQISELALCSIFFFRCAGQGAFWRRKVLREGGRAENDCRYVQQA